MSRIRGRNTGPELAVRQLLHSLGYRYRLHGSDLPGKPDIVFRSRRKAVFVHGCFWHRHSGCRLARMPKSRLEFWRPKLEGNKERDRKNLKLLKNDGWKTLVVWECEISNVKKLASRLRRFLDEGC